MMLHKQHPVVGRRGRRDHPGYTPCCPRTVAARNRSFVPPSRHVDPSQLPDAWWRRLRTDERGQGIAGYAAVALVFVVVLIVVLTTLGDSIGRALQELIDQLPFGG